MKFAAALAYRPLMLVALLPSPAAAPSTGLPGDGIGLWAGATWERTE